MCQGDPGWLRGSVWLCVPLPCDAPPWEVTGQVPGSFSRTCQVEGGTQAERCPAFTLRGGFQPRPCCLRRLDRSIEGSVLGTVGCVATALVCSCWAHLPET